MKIATALRLVRNILADNERAEYSRYLFAERFTRWIYPAYRFSDFGRSFQKDEDFLAYYRRFCSRTTYRTLDRKFTLFELLKLVADVPGDTAECGVFEGAASYLIAKRIAGSGKEHHVFDSFEGLSAPEGRDGSYWRAGDMSVPEARVRDNLAEFPFIRYHRGWIPERFKDVEDRRFSFVHVDVDLYQPTYDSVAFFYDRLSPGGLIVCDDYGFESCPGARDAMDAFFADKPEPIVHLPTGQGFAIRRSAQA